MLIKGNCKGANGILSCIGSSVRLKQSPLNAEDCSVGTTFFVND